MGVTEGHPTHRIFPRPAPCGPPYQSPRATKGFLFYFGKDKLSYNSTLSLQTSLAHFQSYINLFI